MPQGCPLHDARRRLVALLSLNPQSWLDHAIARFRSAGRGAVVLRRACACCGRPQVSYAALSENPSLSHVFADYVPSEEIVVYSAECGAFFRIASNELRDCSRRTLN